MIKQTQDGAGVVVLHELRGGTVTAAATLTTGSPVTFIAGDADYFLDIIEIRFSTTSSVAAGTASFGIDLINDGTIAGHFDMMNIGGTVQAQFPLPFKQLTKNLPWVLDMDDVTGTTVKVAATLVKKNLLT